MDPSHYTGSPYPTYDEFVSLRPYETGFDLEAHRLLDQYPPSLSSHNVPADCPPGTLHTQQAVAHYPVGIFPARDEPLWHQPPTEYRPLARDGPSSIGSLSTQPQDTYLSHAEEAVWIVQSCPASESNDRQEQPQLEAHQRPIPRGPARQEAYKLTRRHAEFEGSDVIRFVVNGGEGIRLSDALEGNWEGFEGRDDRSLFEGNRLQIILRLQFVGCSPWQSKIPITDFTAKRRPITRMKLVAQVAKSIQKFIKREKLNGHDGGHPGCSWGGVSLENVFLNRMVRVSAASWQPEICVERPPALPQVASSSS